MDNSSSPEMIIEILSLFPDGIRTVLNESIIARAQRFGIVDLDLVQLRDYSDNKHNTVDDKPFGGGPGMVLKAEPIARAIEDLCEKRPEHKPKIILTSPQGRLLDQNLAEELSREKRLMILCGHYKGVDQRAIDKYVDMEVSIGDYVVTGGELPAALIVDSVVRLIPGVIGDIESALGDSFSSGLLDHPHYTHPSEWRGEKVPEVLTSGHHAKISEWRLAQAKNRTEDLRPDLFQKWENSRRKDSRK